MKLPPRHDESKSQSVSASNIQLADDATRLGVDPERRIFVFATLLSLLGCAGRPDLQDREAPGGAPPTGADAGFPNPTDAGGDGDDGGANLDEDAGHHADIEDPEGCPSSVPDVEGPFYIEGAPRSVDLIEPGMVGEPIMIRGRVTDTDCEPLPRAVLDFWHANDDGNYDNEGWTWRASLLTGRDGEFSFRTILPGYFGNRPRHIHIKVSAGGHELLTTQLYFADDPKAPSSGAQLRLLLDLHAEETSEREAIFDFALLPTPSLKP